MKESLTIAISIDNEVIFDDFYLNGWWGIRLCIDFTWKDKGLVACNVMMYELDDALKINEIVIYAFVLHMLWYF